VNVAVHGLLGYVFTPNANRDVAINRAPEPDAITDVAITVTAPVTGATPDTTATGTGDFTIGAVTWVPASSPFQGETAYTARVTLTANTGHTFTGLTTATINGFPATVTNNTGATVTLSYMFPATTALVTGITKVEISNNGSFMGFTSFILNLTLENTSGSEEVDVQINSTITHLSVGADPNRRRLTGVIPQTVPHGATFTIGFTINGKDVDLSNVDIILNGTLVSVSGTVLTLIHAGLGSITP
jgi:hypothetical protein